VAAISNSVKNSISIPTEREVPSSSAQRFVVDIYIYAHDGTVMEDPDSNTVNVAVKTYDGTSRNSNLYDAASAGSTTTTMVRQDVGHYRVWYEVGTGHAVEQLRFDFDYAESSNTVRSGATVQIVATASTGGFASGDRTKLEAIYDKLPSRSYFAGSTASTGALVEADLTNLDQAISTTESNIRGADSDTLKTLSDQIDGVPAGVWANGTRELTSAANITSDDSSITVAAGVVSQVNLVNTTTTNSDMRGTDSALLASSAPTNFGSFAITVGGAVTVGTNADKTGYTLTTAEREAIRAEIDSNSTQLTAVNADTDTLLARLTAARATNLDNLTLLDRSIIATEANIRGGSETLDSVATAVAALENLSAADLLATVITEGYVGDHTANRTLSQLLCELLLLLNNRVQNGTKLEYYGLDGVTKRGEATLNSASSPTSVLRSS